ncbi:MAG: hypothetical protein LW860_03690 [Xanthomonadaceae bacterium]|jgi:hypothetical protein|nr:hypothetical protein [Xanthomonadaceae bacterium]
MIPCRPLLALFALLSMSCGALAQAVDPVVRGGQVYRDLCAMCHAADPNRDRPAAAARRQDGVLTALETTGAMRFLRSTLSAADISAVQAWLDFVVLPAGAVRPETGIWWNPAEPGRGFALEYGQGFMTFSAYFYADDGRPDWATAAFRYDGSVAWGEAPLNQFRDGQALLAPWREALLAPSPGAVSIRFDSPTRATITWPGGSVPVERVLLEAGTTARPPAPGYPEPGLWWNPAETGRGYVLDVQGTSVMLLGYLYDDDGRALWFNTIASMPTRFRFEADWYRFADGQTLRGAFRPVRRVEPPVGRVVIDFDTPRSGVLTLPGGRRVPIVRYF